MQFFQSDKSQSNPTTFRYKERTEVLNRTGPFTKKLADTRYFITGWYWLFIHGGITSGLMQNIHYANGVVRNGYMEKIHLYLNRLMIFIIMKMIHNHLWSRIYSDIEEFDNSSNRISKHLY